MSAKAAREGIVPNVSDLMVNLLSRRGLIAAEDINTFLHPEYDRDTHDPFLLQDMDKAVARVMRAIRENERIVVYGDFDCDGIPGTAVLLDVFAKIGHDNVRAYIPHRDREGHGFHVSAVDELSRDNAQLIITVDCGVTAVETAEHAARLGIDVIITDHHEVVGELPRAIAVINPKLGTYPFRDLCGAATGWKLGCAVLREGKRQGLPEFLAIPDGWEKWLLDLVGISTVADMVPLIGENRVLAHFGLMVLRKTPRLGVRALCTRARLKQPMLTEDDIAFSFAPRINAASRMDEPEIALRLLTTKDADEAEKSAALLEELNKRRRGVVGAIVKEAKHRVRARFTDTDKVVVLGDVEWKPALLGLAANAIMEERGGLVCLWGRDANGNLKGSCRSDGTLSVVDVCSRVSDSLIEYGGHKASGGFAVSHESVHDLPEKMKIAAADIEVQPVAAEYDSDAELSLSQVSTSLFQELSMLAPFGVGNPKPVFRISRTRITFARQFGKEMNHTEVSLVCTETGVTCRAFQYFRTPMDFSVPPSPGTAVEVLATVERDQYKGPYALVLRLADIVLPRT